MKLMIAIPTLDYVHFEFVQSLTGLIRRLDGVNYDINFKAGTLVYLARDALAMEAMANGYTHVLWLDADMVFKDDVFEKLSAHQAPFVVGAFNGRHGARLPCVFQKFPDRLKEYPKETFEIDGCGFGCVLMRTEILRDVYREYGFCFQPTADLGEDLAFCYRAKQLGYKLICDPSVKVGHIGNSIIWPN